MSLSKSTKQLRKEHTEHNHWRRSRRLGRVKMPWHLMTPAERRRQEAKERTDTIKLEDKRNLDLQIKEICGLKLPYEWMSHYIRGAGDNKRVRIIEKRELMSFSRIDGNTCDRRGRRTKFKFMMFDIDSDLSRDEFFRITGIMPNYFVGKLLPDGRIQRPHAIIELLYPVPLSGKDAWGDRRRFESIYADLYERLKAAGVDVDYGQKTTFKNPDYDGWDVVVSNTGAVLLRHLKDDLDLKAARDAAFRATIIEITGVPEQAPQMVPLQALPKRRSRDPGTYAGRNDTLFHTVRLQIMAEWKTMQGGDIHAFSYRLLKDLNISQGFSLSDSELRGIAKSHAKFFARYKGPRNPHRKFRNEGAAKHLILFTMTKREKQAVGAHYTHAICASRTAKLIQDFKKRHPEATISFIAKKLKIDRKTVRKYLYLKSPNDLAALKKIKELRESAAAYWQTKNLASVIIAEIWPGESGPIRRKHFYKGADSEPDEETTNDVKLEKSVKFSSQLVQKIREARRKHPAIDIYRRRIKEKESLDIHSVDSTKPEIDFLAAFV